MMRMKICVAVLMGLVCVHGALGHAVPAATPSDRLSYSNWWAKAGFWQRRINDARRAIAQGRQKYDIVFCGDSNTQNWEGWRDAEDLANLRHWINEGRITEERAFVHLTQAWVDLARTYSLLNLGVSGDSTQHLLWRLTQGGLLGGYTARYFCILIGGNNLHQEAGIGEPEDVLAGIQAIIAAIRAKHPEAKVILHTLLPAGIDLKNRVQIRRAQVNAQIPRLADGKNVLLCDFAARLANADGSPKKQFFADSYHINEAGFRIWSEAVQAVIRKDALKKRAAMPREEGLYRSQVHRGGGGKYPDNALETFLWCWGHGCTPEADARLTKDGVAIAMHDKVLDRIGFGFPARLKGVEARNLTWNDLRDVDIGSKWGAQYATYRIATMESVFAVMAGRPERLLYLDEKGAPPQMMAEMAARFGVMDQTFFCSSDWRKVVQWRQCAPFGRSMVWLGNFPRNNSPENVAKTEAFVQKRLDEMAAFGFEGIDQVQIHIRTDLSLPDPFCPSTPFIKRAIDLLHKNGVSVNGVTWTHGTNEDLYQRMWDLGFDHFTTDYPDTLFKVIENLKRGK